MKFTLRPGLVLAALLSTSAVAETWETVNGDRISGKVTGLYGPFVQIAEAKTSRFISVSELKDDELGRVADFLAKQPATPPPWSGSTSKVAKAVKGRLQVLRGDKLVDFDPGARAEPEFYLVYFGAEWCPPCRAFSPRFVKAYERLRSLAPDKFEAIFVSSDREPAEQLKYIRHVSMPWPVVKFSHLGRAEAIERWAGAGIPCLVVLSREGEPLFHSYRGTQYVGPDDVLMRFEQLLLAMQGKGEMKRTMHRLAVVQHVRTAGEGTQKVQPYLINLDLSRYRTLEVKQITATLDIDEKGAVIDAAIQPELPVVLQHQLVTDAGTWLFLPFVKAGKPTRTKVSLPIVLTE